MTKSTDLPWFKLNPDKADYNATHGAYIGGNTLLALPSGTVVIVGHMSCADRASAETHAARLRGQRGDRAVSRAALLRLKATK